MSSIDQAINNLFEPVATAAAGVIFYAEPFTGYDIKLIVVWLVAASAFFTIYLGFINFRGFKHALYLVSGKGNKGEGKDGEISPFQALSASLSGTVGLGNIAGVAVAVSLGGPGAVFWMVVMGFLGMSAKFAEVMLGVKYRVRGGSNHEESLSGGPMYYLKHAFAKHGMTKLGVFVAGFFAICGIGGAFGGGNMFQANQSMIQLMNVTGGEDASFWADKKWLFGLILAFSVGIVIIGGIKSIAKAASRIVPLMGLLYLVTGLIVIALHWYAIPEALMQIVVLAFDPASAYGGILGALLVGAQRAAFSNEAGLGSAAIVHSAVKTDQPVSQGFVGMLGPFIDTVVICLVTALVIVVTGAYLDSDGVEGVALTSRALESGIGGAQYILAIVVILFAYSTLITWSYYGQKCLTYLVGENDMIVLIYKLVFCGFVIVGASMSELKSVIDFSDAMIFAMGIPNIIGLYLLAPEIKKDLKDYWATQKAGPKAA